MSVEELDFQATELGALTLRRRQERLLGGIDVYEVLLGDAYLMSSLFHAAEDALANVAMAQLPDRPLNVVVGGLGLGYTAVAALSDPRVESLVVVELLQPVIDWHQRALVPLGNDLTADSRCRLQCGDFFALAQSESGFDPAQSGRRFDAILLDIDHSSTQHLDPRSQAFYSEAGLQRLAAHLTSDGVFAFWSNDPPEPAFMTLLEHCFARVDSQEIYFENPYQGDESANTIYVAQLGAA